MVTARTNGNTKAGLSIKKLAWSEAELRASVEAYFDMLQQHDAGIKFNKKQYYDRLSEKFGRTAKSFEYRMQNISFVFSRLGRAWLPGLNPAKNVGANVAAAIADIIEKIEGKKSLLDIGFEIEVETLRQKKVLKAPVGNTKPSTKLTTVTLYNRDSRVKAFVLREAGSTCECCGNEAPFCDIDGIPFLEVHHIKRLADEGSDRPSNAVAICPNCHRELHYGSESTKRIDQMYLTIKRLIRE
jgi:5-methylcytosine-specific restriction protein A